MIPARIQGRLTLRAISKSFMPSASAPSLGRRRHLAQQVPVVAATMGMIITPSTSPADSSPSPAGT